MKKVKKVATIADVAKKAGVSKTAVSFVLNDAVGVSETTKQKVLQVIKELNYVPNTSARSLRLGSTKRIAIVAYKFSSNYLSVLIQGFERKFFGLQNQEYTLDFYSTESSEKKKNEILKDILYARKAEAVVLISQKPTKTIESEYQKLGIPLLLIENESEISSSIVVDNYAGASLAVEHLISRNRSKVGIISPRYGLQEKGFVANDRLRAYVDCLTNHALTINENYQWDVLELLKEEGYDLADEIINSGVDALFVSAGDLVAIGFLERCKERGVKVPDDISLVGFDNMFFSSLISPSLTTVDQPIAKMGEIAFDIVYAQINNKMFTPESIVMDPTLVVRESS